MVRKVWHYVDEMQDKAPNYSLSYRMEGLTPEHKRDNRVFGVVEGLVGVGLLLSSLNPIIVGVVGTYTLFEGGLGLINGERIPVTRAILRREENLINKGITE